MSVCVCAIFAIVNNKCGSNMFGKGFSKLDKGYLAIGRCGSSILNTHICTYSCIFPILLFFFLNILIDRQIAKSTRLLTLIKNLCMYVHMYTYRHTFILCVVDVPPSACVHTISVGTKL